MFPKECGFAVAGKCLRKAPSAGSSVTGISSFYRVSLDHETVDNGRQPRLVAADKARGLWHVPVGTYAWATMEPKPPTIHDLYPHLTPEECALAEDNLRRYLLLVLRIFERLEAESARTGQPLGELIRRGRLKASP